MQVVVAIPGQKMEVRQIDGGMTPIQKIVGGPLECVQLGEGFILYSNQDSNEKGLPMNPHFAQGIIKGNFVIAKKDPNGNLVGLESEDIGFIEKAFIRDDTNLENS